jgi:hypothetical protein
MGFIYVLMDLFEGMPYQIAYYAQFGYVALAGAFLIAATILKRKEPLPWWLSFGYVHILTAFVSVCFGVTWWFLDRPAHWGDIYHHLFVAPLFLYMVLTLLPVILINGTKVEKFWALCFALSWATLLIRKDG